MSVMMSPDAATAPDPSDDEPTGGFDRRALIKKAAVVSGGVWVAPAFVTSRAGATGINCFYVGRGAADDSPCTTDAPAVGCKTDLKTMYPSGCDQEGNVWTLDVTPDGADLNIVDPDSGCYIQTSQAMSSLGCSETTHPSGNKTWRLDRTDDPASEPFIHVGMVVCCPDDGSLGGPIETYPPKVPKKNRPMK